MKKKISAWESYKEEVRKNKLVFLTVIFGPLLFLLFIKAMPTRDTANNGVSCSLLESKKNNGTVVSCIYKCSKSSRSKTFYYTPIGSPSYCPGYPNSGYKDVEGSYIFKN